VLDTIGLKHLGIYRDTAEKKKNYPLFIEKNGIKIALLNYTYGTNLLEEEAPNIVNRIDTALIAEDIKRAKIALPDFIIAIVHWGTEYQIVQNEWQSWLAKFMALKGVNLIIGGHPHVVQPFDKIPVPGSQDSTYVIYSLGNFFSNQRDRHTDGGVMFEVTLKKEGKTKIADYGYMPFWVYRFEKNGDKVFRLLPNCKKNASFCKEYKLSRESKAAMELFFEDTKKILKNLPIISPKN
jgi:poly-gamma-glutamate synthesis protein (capsule biosynthesis protein)